MFRRAGRGVNFLLLKRSKSERPYPGIWQVVSGRVRGKEKASETALREVQEETGTHPLRMWVLPLVNSFYAAREDAIQSVPTFAVEVSSSADVFLSKEHESFAWVTRRKAASLVQWPAHLDMMDLVRSYILHERGSIHRIPIH